MKKERYTVEIEMPIGDAASSTWVRDTLQSESDIEDEGRWKVSAAVMQNFSWSEEDEKMVRALMSICDEWATRHSYLPEENNDIEKIKSWFKYLKDRYAWKPSKMQIQSVKDCALNKNIDAGTRLALDALYQELLKLNEL